MGTAQDRVNAATKAQKSNKIAIHDALMQPAALSFVQAMAPGMDPRALAMVAYSTVAASPMLRDCTPASVVRAVAEAAKLKLGCDGVLGHAYLVPFKDRRRGVTEATMMIGYRGIQHLAYESGRVSRIHADVIRENDTFVYREGAVVEFLHERPRLGQERGERIGAYAIAHPKDSGPPWIAVLDAGEVEARRASSRAKDGPWKTHPDAMWRKSAVRELGKQMPVPTLQAAALRDEARDEGRPAPPSTLDLGDADVLPVEEEAPAAAAPNAERDDLKANLEAGKCLGCGRLKLNKDGSCPDCDPREGGSA